MTNEPDDDMTREPGSGTPNSALRAPRSLRLLVLEDRPVDAELMVAELKRQGFEPSWTRVETEDEFVAALDERLDVILSDFNLPGFDALQAIDHVRQRALSVPVIVVTGAVGEETAARCIREGAADYLLKDRLARLGLAVRQAVERRRLSSQRRQIESALVASQAELTTVFESAPVAMVILDAERRVVRANRAAARLAGRPVDDAFGRLPGDVFECLNALDDPDGCRAGSRCASCPLRTLVRETLDQGTELHGIECAMPFHGSEDRAPLTLLVSSSPIETQMGRLAVVSLEDISERQRAHERERRLTRLLATIRDVNQLIVREHSRDWILAECCRILVEQAGFRLAWIGEAETDTGLVRPLAVAGDETGAALLCRATISWDGAADSRCPVAAAIAERRTVVVADAEAGHSTAGWCDGLHRHGFHYGAAVPLLVHDRPFGVLTVYGAAPGDLDGDSVGLLEELADDLGFALGALETAARREAAEQALQESEERYRQLYEAESDAILLIDNQSGRILEANSAATALYGYSHEELLGLRNSDLSAEPEDTTRVTTSTPLDRDRVVRIPLRFHRCRDGTVLPVEITGRFFSWQGRPVHVAAIRDISERRRGEDLLQRDLEVREALADISRCVLEDAIDVPDVARTVLAHARRLTGSEHGFVSEVDPASGDNVGHTLTEMLAGQCQVAGEDRRVAFPRSPDGSYAGLWGFALNTALPFYTNQPSHHPASAGTPDNHVPIERYLAVPVTSAGEVLGLIALANPPRDFTDQDLELVGRLADYYAMALVKSHVEADLADSEQRYRTLFEQAPIGIYRSTPAGEILAANPALVRMLGYGSSDELAAVGVEAAAFTSDGERRRFRQALEARGELVGHFAEWRTRDGQPLFVRESARVIRDADGEVLYYEGTVEDVSESHRARRERDLMFDLAVDMFCVSSFDGRLLQVNPACERILGWSADELLSQTFLSFIHPDDRQDALAAYATLGAGRPVLASENRVRCRDGSYRWLSWNAHPLPAEGLVFAVAHDITERRQAEQALRASERRYREFFLDDLTADFITTFDGELLDCNPAYLKIFGFADEAEARATDVARLYRSTHDRRQLLERLRTEHRLENVELSLRQRDGIPIEVVGNMGLVLRGDGEPPLIKGYLFDITERRQLEEQLRHSQKMEAVGRLAGGVAHDFNNLLQALVSQTQLLHSHRDQPERLTAVAAEIEQQVQRGASLTRQLLLFSRRETTQLAELDLNAVVRGQTSMLRRLVPANIALELELADEPLPVEADHGQLEQVLMNLVLNAADALADGGRIVVRSGRGDGEEVWIAVEDDGPGVPEELRGKVFEPFFTTKPSQKGTGLGLAVVHGIVTQHHGRITIGDRAGGGALFTVTLPRRTTEPGQQPAPAAADRPSIATGDGQRVLVVEDEEATRTGLCDLLAAIGYQAVGAGSAEEAVALPHEPAFDLLLTDLMLPGQSGAELAETLAQRWPGMQVLLMSGYAEDEVVRRGIGAGAVRFLQKPFDVRTLAGELQELLAGDESSTVEARGTPEV